MNHDFVLFLAGAIAGLVAITPAAGFVSQSGAFVIGVVGGVAVSRGVLIKDIFEFDDALDAFGVHAIAGLIGSLMVGLFAKEEIGGANGAFYGHPKQLGLQFYGVVVTAGWACVGTWLVMTFVDVCVGLRVSPSKEDNLDRSQVFFFYFFHYLTLTLVEKVWLFDVFADP
jgi:ammonium transporter, Amt family